MKDQSKKVASLKHKEQVEKSKNARLMEEARKREDNLSENSQQVKVRRVCGSPGLINLIETFTFLSTALLSQFINCKSTNSNSCFIGHLASEV